MLMDPSAVCRLHPGVAVTGFCPACLRDRLAGLQPPSSADLRRCKSFSYARSASGVEPQRRSCDLFRHHQVPEDQAADYQYQYQYQEEPQAERASRRSFLGRKLQQWRRKSNKEPEIPPGTAQAQRHRPSCDVPVLARLPATMLSQLPVEEDDDDDMTMAPPPVPRSDGQIPVEEDYYCYMDDASANPGGTAQTRDYYLDSSSSSRRRRSVDRSTTSGRNSFSDVNNGGGELPASWATAANGNARVSPAIAAERPLYHHHHYHHEAQSVLVHHHQYDFSTAGSHRQSSQTAKLPNSNKKQGIRGWSIWGLLHKKSSRKQQPPAEAAPAGADDGYPPYPWPELRARGYDGQMLRCNSSISARSSFSGGAAMIGGSGRRSISGVDMRGDALLSEKRRTRRADEVLLERTRSSSYSRSSGHGLVDPAAAMGVHHQQQLSSRPPRRSSSKHDVSSMLHRRSTLGL